MGFATLSANPTNYAYPDYRSPKSPFVSVVLLAQLAGYDPSRTEQA